MIDDFNKKEIEKISFQLLKDSKSFDIFPTPVDKILNYSEFVLDNKIDLLNIESTFIETLKENSVKTLQSAISKVKGIFDRREKTIYLDLSLDKNIGKKNFVQLHEIGHGVLPWQDNISLCLDNDETLAPEITEQFEAEANYFASLTLFQHDRFTFESEKLKLGLSSVLLLKKKFGSSVHATFRNYVLKSNFKCSLLVLTPIPNSLGNNALCVKRNLFHSDPFLLEIGKLNLPNEFGYKWNFIKDFKFNKKFKENGVITLNTITNEKIILNYHFFNNSYNSFVFFFPKGEVTKGKTKVVLKNI